MRNLGAGGKLRDTDSHRIATDVLRAFQLVGVPALKLALDGLANECRHLILAHELDDPGPHLVRQANARQCSLRIFVQWWSPHSGRNNRTLKFCQNVPRK